MIISRIWAGLANQLFQYAAGKSLASFHNTSFKIDRRWYDLSISGETPRTFQLDHFNIDVEVASDAEMNHFPFTRIQKLKFGRSILPRFQAFLQRNSSYSKLRSYRELHFHYDPKFFELSSDVYLIGYFQSEHYFKHIEQDIRREFTFKLPPTSANGELIREIQSTNAVSLHVRRGDYILDPRTHLHHGVCDLSYYKQAVQEIRKRVSNPHFFIFSDDMSWVKKHMHLGGNMTFITGNQGDMAYEDLRLMSHCRHHILANSSFSWWGAWLNPKSDKIVIAPKKWTNISLKLSDLFLAGWIVI